MLQSGGNRREREGEGETEGVILIDSWCLWEEWDMQDDWKDEK
jgi:hypothetical protein